MTPASPPNHPVIAGLRWILAHRTQPDGGKLSMRALSRAAGLAPGHVEQIVNGRQSADIERSTAVKLARAGDVRVSWLLTGQGAREPFDEGEVSPQTRPLAPAGLGQLGQLGPPGEGAPERYWSSELVEDWLVQALDKARHRGKHVTAVRRLLLELPALMRKDADMVAFTGRALDAAATLDARGEPLAPSELLYEMSMTQAPRAPVSADGRSRWDMAGDEDLRRHGVDPPGWKGEGEAPPRSQKPRLARSKGRGRG